VLFFSNKKILISEPKSQQNWLDQPHLTKVNITKDKSWLVINEFHQ